MYRRSYLSSAIVLLTTLAVACGGAAAPTATPAKPASTAVATTAPAGQPTGAAQATATPTRPAPTTTARVTASRGKIVLVSPTDIGTTNTIVGTSSDRGPYDSSLNLGLTKDDHDAKVVPAGAKSWGYSEDGKVITFAIRDDIIFHDGTKVTVDDWVYRYDDLWLHPVQPRAIPPSTPPVPVKIEKVDSARFRIVWPSPDASFLEFPSSAGPGKGGRSQGLHPARGI